MTSTVRRGRDGQTPWTKTSSRRRCPDASSGRKIHAAKELNTAVAFSYRTHLQELPQCFPATQSRSGVVFGVARIGDNVVKNAGWRHELIFERKRGVCPVTSECL